MNGLGGAMGASIVVHAVGLGAAATLLTTSPPVAPPPIPIEVVRVDPPPPPPLPPAPKPIARPRPLPTAAKPVLRAENFNQSRATLIADASAAFPSPPVASSSANRWVSRAASAGGGNPTPGAPAGAGTLFSTGDLPILSDDGAAGGRGAEGAGGSGASGVAAVGDGAGLTSFARPLAGYQTKPPYPESARRAGIEGTTTLRFEVRADGRVGRVEVSRTAGHPDLDRAAAEAVKSWRFEPARRGKEAVAVWVTLPVRFALSAY